MRRPNYLLVWPVVATRAADTIKVAWTTDNQEKWGIGSFGPDGPWQAIVARVGSQKEYAAMWPNGGGRSIVPTTNFEAGGNYSTRDSSTAFFIGEVVSPRDDWAGIGWGKEMFKEGRAGYDLVSFDGASGDGTLPVNVSLTAANQWIYNVNWGENYTDPVGVLGFGQRIFLTRSEDTSDQPQSILESLKSEGQIASRTFGMHLGSVPFEQPGSLVLGGYEKNRALGPVGIFDYDLAAVEPLPYMFLIDIIMGHEAGESPYIMPEVDEGSVFGGIGEEYNDYQAAERFTRQLGGKPNSTIVIVPNAVSAYISLPYGSHDKLTDRLPVDWDDLLGNYVWDTNNPAYTKIVQSSAYLAFVFADRNEKNITVKVPFSLLNLTVEPHLAERSRLNRTQYFPVQSVSGDSFWVFGRAFLQAAFFAYDLENEVTYLAQAPGPAMKKSEILTFQPQDFDLSSDFPFETDPIEQFATSWLPRWTVYNKDGTTSPGRDLVPPEEENPEEGGGREEKVGVSQDRGGLGTGAVVGIVIGVLAVALAAAGYFVHRYFKRRTERVLLASQNAGSNGKGWTKSHDGQVELDGETKTPELETPNMAHEMESSHNRHEVGVHMNANGAYAPWGHMDYVELPAEDYPDSRRDLNSEPRR